MADNDRDTDRTTIVETGGGGGSGGVIAVVLLIIVVLVLLFLFRGQLGFGGDKTEIKVPDKIGVDVNTHLSQFLCGRVASPRPYSGAVPPRSRARLSLRR
jgi:hypothetical protein